MLVWPMTEVNKPLHVPREIDHESIELRVMVRSVVSAILHAAPSHPDVDDATNETLRRALEGKERVRDGEPMRSWVVGIARHVARDVLRARVRAAKRSVLESPSTDSTPELTERVPDSKPSPLDRALRTEEISRLASALRTLPEMQRRALEMFHVEGESYQTISTRLKVPVGTVATWILRARRALADALREEAQ